MTQIAISPLKVPCFLIGNGSEYLLIDSGDRSDQKLLVMVCITLGMKNTEKYQDVLKAWMEPVRMIVRPYREGYFAGSLEVNSIPFSFNALAMLAAVNWEHSPLGITGIGTKFNPWQVRWSTCSNFSMSTRHHRGLPVWLGSLNN